MLIQSKINPSCVWKIKQSRPISADDVEFIETFNPTLYCNDLSGVIWAFDTKLPSGAWLENIHFDNDLKTARAFIF